MRDYFCGYMASVKRCGCRNGCDDVTLGLNSSFILAVDMHADDIVPVVIPTPTHNTEPLGRCHNQNTP